MSGLLPHGELVAIAWILGIEGIPAGKVGTTVPRDESSWQSTGFVQVSVVGGTPGLDTPIYNPVISVDCWAASPHSSKPPWGVANQLAEKIAAAGYGNVDAASPTTRIVSIPGYANANVAAAYAVTKPKRIPSDEARFARYQFDLQVHYIPLVGVI